MLNNFRVYRLHGEWPDDETELSDKLATVAFKPCGTFNERSFGFEAPVETEDGSLARRLAGADLMQLRAQSRVLPNAAINEALEERIEDFSRRTLRPPGRKEKRDLKEEVIGELLPKALLKSDRIRGFYLHKPKALVIATATPSVAEDFMDRLREALGSLQVTPLAFKRPASNFMQEIFMGKGTDSFYLGRECRMKDAGEPKSSVSWFDMDLADSSVRKHVNDGLSIDRLGMSFDSVLKFVLDGDFVFRKVRFEGLESLDEMDEEDPLARHDAEFAIEAGVIARLLDSMKTTLGGFA